MWFPRLLWFLGTGSKGVDHGWFFGAVLLRDAAVLALAVLVVRDILRPERTWSARPTAPAGRPRTTRPAACSTGPRTARPPVLARAARR